MDRFAPTPHGVLAPEEQAVVPQRREWQHQQGEDAEVAGRGLERSGEDECGHDRPQAREDQIDAAVQSTRRTAGVAGSDDEKTVLQSCAHIPVSLSREGRPDSGQRPAAGEARRCLHGGGRQIVLAEVNAVCTGGGSDIRTVIDDHAYAGLACDRGGRRRRRLPL